MKRIVLFIIVSISCFWCSAQKHDYQWLFGYGNANPDTNFGGVILNFNDSPVKVYDSRRQAGFDDCNTSYCNNNGQLVMYSNGTDIYDLRDSVMQNGDSINYSDFWNYWGVEGQQRYEGLGIYQSMLSLPAPQDSSFIYVLHYTIKFLQDNNGIGYVTDDSYYSLIDMKGNFGYGSVIKKDVGIGKSPLAESYFSAVQHGNGKDWWILHPYYYGNKYYKFLLDSRGVLLHDTQSIGTDLLYYGAIGASCFSPDGGKYFWVNAGDGIRMFDFDRCTGVLSNPSTIAFPFPSFTDSFDLVAGIAISPNNRFLYVVGETIALQYDLEATDIGSSVQIIARWDGGYAPKAPFASTFFLAQLGPDGKIYINSIRNTSCLHIIEHPNEQGNKCTFIQRGINLTTFNASIPNFPNYRLGRLVGSVCDTLWNNIDEATIQQREKNLKVFPNPAIDIVTIDYGFTDWSKAGTVTLEIINELGQLMHSQPVPQYSGFQKIDVNQYSTGIYTTYIKRNNSIIATAKFAKE